MTVGLSRGGRGSLWHIGVERPHGSYGSYCRNLTLRAVMHLALSANDPPRDLKPLCVKCFPPAVRRTRRR